MTLRRLPLVALLLCVAVFSVSARRRRPPGVTIYTFEGFILMEQAMLRVDNGFYAPLVSGRVDLRFTRNADGKIIDGPVDLTFFSVSFARPDLLTTTFELDTPITATLQNGLIDFGSPNFTQTIVTTCAGYCIPLRIPESFAAASSPVGSFSALANVQLGGTSLEFPFSHQSVPIDLGLGSVEVAAEGRLQFVQASGP